MNTMLKQIEKTESLTASEAIINYGLNWEVAKKAVVVDGIVQPDFVAVRREDTKQVFQVSSPSYLPIQNKDMFSFFDEIVKTGQAKYINGGYYKKGAIVWLRAKVPCDFNIAGDEHKTYIKLTSSHDGTVRLVAQPEVYRQVCTNGMHALVKDYQRSVSVKHTKNAEKLFISNAKEIYKQEVEYFQMFAEKCNKMAKQTMTNLEIDSFLNELFKVDASEVKTATRTENKIEVIRNLSINGTGMSHIKGTAWGLYNAITEYVDRYMPVRKTDETESTDEKRDFSANFGSGLNLREEAFALLTR